MLYGYAPKILRDFETEEQSFAPKSSFFTMVNSIRQYLRLFCTWKIFQEDWARDKGLLIPKLYLESYLFSLVWIFGGSYWGCPIWGKCCHLSEVQKHLNKFGILQGHHCFVFSGGINVALPSGLVLREKPMLIPGKSPHLLPPPSFNFLLNNFFI